jgi:hypothetical protein
MISADALEFDANLLRTTLGCFHGSKFHQLPIA